MNQSELVKAVSDKSGLAQSLVETALKGLGATVHEVLKSGGEVTVPGICKITTHLRAGRTGKNPRTGEPLQIPAKHVPKIVVLKALKDAAAVEL